MRAVTSGPCRWFSFAVVLVLAALAVGLMPTSAWAQAVNSGNIAGQVTDPQGAVVPGVKVTVADPNTGTTYTATTNAEGRYYLANVPPSSYNITASKSGFATAKVSAQAITVGTTSTIDLKMTVGEVSTTVEVQATNTELQTMNATVGNTITGVALNSLPAIGLDVSTFAVLQPGVSPEGNVAGTVVDQSSFMLDGGQNTNDMDGSMTVYTGSFTGDPSGITGNGSLPSGVVPTPADSVEEFKTNTANQTADFNSSSGMQVQVVTKRGTNRWHGTAYEYYLDNNFSANTWDNNCSTACGKTTSKKLDDWHRSWFGVAGGGPLIPKDILGGKTYFFANYQGSRWPLSQTFTRTIPGPGMIQGLLQTKNGVVYNLNPTATTYNGPTLGSLTHGVKYPTGSATSAGVLIDPTNLDPRNLGLNPVVATMWNKYVPTVINSPQFDPSGGDQLNSFGFRGQVSTPRNDNFGVARLDHDFGAKWHFFGSYRYYRLINATNTQVDIGGFLGGKAGVANSVSSNPQVPWFYVAGLTTNLTSTTTNDFHWSFTRNWWAWARAGDVPQVAGVGGSLGAALEPGGESSTGGYLPYNVSTQSTRTRFWDGLDHMFRDDITSLHGNHLFQFGGTYQRNHDKHQRTDNGGGINYSLVYQLGNSSGSSGSSVSPPSIPAGVTTTQFRREYDSVLGIVSISQIAFTRSGPNLALNPPHTPANEDSIIPFYNVYFSDSWHMKPSLTLTYGLGWTLEQPPIDSQGRQIEAVDASGQQLDAVAYLKAKQQAALQGQPYNPAVGFALIGNTSGGQLKYPYNPFYGEFSPRVAVAWNPDFGDSFLARHLLGGGKNTVIRGGYGRIYGRLNGVDLVLVPLLGTGLIQPVQCIKPTISGGCGGANASTAFRIGTDGLTAPLAAASPTLPQPDFPGISICGVPTPSSVCPEAGAGEGFDPHFRPNVTDSFTVSIQRQIGQRNTLEIGYIGRLIRNEYLPLNINAVPYMFTKGGQQFQQAYAAIEKQMGCATSVAACYNADPNLKVTSQPFFEAALSGTGYCAPGTCTQAVYANEFGNFQSQNVWDLWSDLDQNFPGTKNPGFNFGPTMMNSPGAGGSANGMLSSGVGLNASVGYGNYHSGYVSWRMANWHGLTSQTNLTWGKALGTGAVVQASSEYAPDDPFNVRTMYGYQSWDRKFVLNSFFVYEPPFFKGQTGLIGRLLGGWNIAPLFSTGSGQPLYCNGGIGGSFSEAFGSGDGTNFFDNEQCVMTGPYTGGTSAHFGVTGGTDIAGNGVGTSPIGSVKQAQINQFSNPLAVWNSIRPAILGIDNGRDGGFGQFRTLPFWNLDLSVKKNFKVTERFSTTFSTVFTNVLNHNQWATPSVPGDCNNCVDISAPQYFGTIRGQQGTPRQIEFSLRVNF
jgi:hypothetical protein